MKYLLTTVLIFFSLMACKQETKSTDEANTQAATAKVVNEKILPGLAKKDIIDLYQQADYIDYIFFDWDFSMNQSEPNAVKAAVTFISDKGPEAITDCKATGRLVFQAKGEIIREADMFFSEGCYFYTFVDESNRPQYHNAMTDQGISFYGKMFKQAFAPAQQGQ